MILAGILLFSSCGTRKYKGGVPGEGTKAAKAAEAMSLLRSKKLYNFITEWTGAPYQFGGLDKRGIDCSGFALLLQKEIYGLSMPRVSRDQAEAVKQKSLAALKEGDLIFFAFGGGAVDHVGVYLNNNFFVHASTSKGVIVDDLSLPVYQKAIVKVGTLKSGSR